MIIQRTDNTFAVDLLNFTNPAFTARKITESYSAHGVKIENNFAVTSSESLVHEIAGFVRGLWKGVESGQTSAREYIASFEHHDRASV